MISLRKLLGLATNATAPGLVISLAVNVALNGEDGWKRLAHYGETDYWEKQADGTWRKFNQIFTKGQAVEMVGAFNTESAKANFRGLPIYVGHPDANPQRWPDDKRLGKISGCEAREDGLWVNVEWNDLGRKNAQEGYYIYPSPAWLFPRALAAQTGKVIPNELQSVGLTNTPNIKDVDAWTNTAPAGGPQPIIDNPETQPMPEHKKKLLKLLGLPDDATDEQIDTAHNAHCAKQESDSAELKKAKKEKTDAETAANTAQTQTETAQADSKKFRELAINTLLDTGITTGRITAADRDALKSKFEIDFDAASTELAARKPALNTQPLNLRPTGDQGDLSTPHGRQLAFNAAIDEQMRPIAAGGKGITNFDAAIDAIRSKPEGAALLKAMGN